MSKHAQRTDRTYDALDDASREFLQAIWDRFLETAVWPRPSSLDIQFGQEVEKRGGIQAWAREIGSDFVHCDAPGGPGRCFLFLEAWSRCRGSERYGDLLVRAARISASAYVANDGKETKLKAENFGDLDLAENERLILDKLLEQDCPFIGAGTLTDMIVGHFASKLVDLRNIADYRERLRAFNGVQAASYGSSASSARGLRSWSLVAEEPEPPKARERPKRQPGRQSRSRTVKLPTVLKTAFGEYRLAEQIGEGGCGRVYAAADSDGNAVAVKVLDGTKATRTLLKRFKNEYTLGARNTHPNIISVRDQGFVDVNGVSWPFYVMQRYSGSLRTEMKTGLAAERALLLFTKILDGVEAAHMQNVVHRDLKPENILVGAGDALVIADFGAAAFAQEDLYTAVETKHERLANFLYSAPEQRTRGLSVDRRADIFALGLLLNEMFTNEVPQGTNFRTVSTGAGAFAFVDLVVEAMIQQSVEKRPNSIADVRSKLALYRNEFLTAQRVDALRGTVVEASSVVDPIVADPIRVIDRDWDDGVLTLILSQPINSKWIKAFQSSYGRRSVPGAGPEHFRFQGDKARVGVEGRSVKRVVDHFDEWLPAVASIYSENLQRENEAALQARKDAILAERAKLEERQRVLTMLSQ